MDSATLRSVLLGAGSVVVATVAIALYHPKALRRPPARPAAVVANVPPASPPLAQEPTPAAPQEAPAEPESLPKVESTEASASDSPPPDRPGETAVVPQPPPQPRAAHLVRRVKRLPTHTVRPAPTVTPPPAPEAAAPEVADTPPPPAEPPLPPLSIVIGVRRAQEGVLSKSVSLADLDLHTPNGACKAVTRIRRAAEEVCPFTDGIGLGLSYERRKCLQETISNTRENMRRAKFDLPDKGC